LGKIDVPAKRMENETLKKLEGRVDDLIGTCRQLKKDNHLIKDEHAKLIEKTQIARTRIESMIGRLKALERGS
jgi:cell division protein ZapB